MDILDATLPAGFERDLAHRPGFLIRRLHQIHVALFAEECAGFDITPVQYSVMSAIALQPGLDQPALSAEVGLDRATLVSVVMRLEEAGYLRRIVSRLDKRQKLITLSARGRAMLLKMQEPVDRAHARTIAALPDEARARFLELLEALVEAGNEYGRAKLRLK